MIPVLTSIYKDVYSSIFKLPIIIDTVDWWIELPFTKNKTYLYYFILLLLLTYKSIETYYNIVIGTIV